MKVLVLGAAGLLGQAFCNGLKGHDVVTASRGSLDVRQPSRIWALVESAAADVVVNCAANTDVDGAERTPETAYRVNAMLPGLVAQACRRSGALLLHISSTGCYGDHQSRPYTEEDPLLPTTVHHKSKMAGEQAVRDSGCRAIILRTGWLFGGSPHQTKNFVWKRLQEAASNPVMASDARQSGNPTWIDDVVHQAMVLIDIGLEGTFNCVGHGTATRFEYVSSIVALSGLPCRVEASAGAFARAARVSPNESATNFRLSLLEVDLMPPWRRSLQNYVDQARAWPEWRALTSSHLEA
jgi:dTDP-4-dehydrorhamnose reductase